MPEEITQVVGARACGKSTLAKIIKALSRDPRVVAMDSKTAIEYHLKRRTEIGEQLEEYTPVMAAGGLLPAHVTFAAIITYVRELERELGFNLLHLILAGSPRRPEEVRLWEDSGIPFKLVYIRSTWEEVLHWAKRRQEEGVERDDCTPEALRESWEAYQQNVVPAVHTVGDENRLILERNSRLLTKVEDTIQFMRIPKHVKSRWLRRLKVPNHPARRMIAEIEPPVLA